MTPAQWQRAKEISAEALECPASKREEFVKSACASDDALLAEVRSLLAEERAIGNFLDTKAASGKIARPLSAFRNSVDSPEQKLPTMVGDYRILDLLGRGGMAVVCKAEQQQPRRVVALKMIKPGLVGPEYERRFEREKDALSRLQHPGIARIYDAGTADAGSGPQPYFAMEFVAQGQPLTAYAESKRLDLRQRLELIAQICDAVQHAHQHFIIHRDLKPTNVLVDENGQPKVLDFGVARLTDNDTSATAQTDLGQVIGTLDYMSPEQALGDPRELDTRSDIYAIGVILYELLAGRRPYDVRNKSQIEALRIIREQDPETLGSMNTRYRGDIETIVSKCLEKDKTRRYASSSEVASDIRRYLNDEPIAARPTTLSYRLHKFVRRNKAFVAGFAAVFIALLLGSIATAWQARAAQARELLAWATQSLTEDPERSLILGLYSWSKGREVPAGLEQLLHDALAESRVQLTLLGHQSEVTAAVWSPDGSKLATASYDKTAKIWDSATGRELLTLRGHEDGVKSIAWSRNGSRFATASDDKTAKIWDSNTGREMLRLRGHKNGITSIVWSPHQDKLATASKDKTAKVWDGKSGQELLTLTGHHASVASIAWSPDGTRLATASLDGTAKVWDATTGRQIITFEADPFFPPDFPLNFNRIAWSPDSSKLATASAVCAQVWQANTGKELLHFGDGSTYGIAWSPDGSELATTDIHRTVKLWDATTAHELLSMQGHQGVVNSVDWSPDGKSVITASEDRSARVWDATRVANEKARSELLTLVTHASPGGIAWSPDGTRIATTGTEYATPPLPTGLPSPVVAAIWEADRGREVLAVGGLSSIRAIAWSPDGRRLAAVKRDKTVRVLDAESGHELIQWAGAAADTWSILWSPDGRRLATVEHNVIRVWEGGAGRQLFSAASHQGGLDEIFWSPNGIKAAEQYSPGMTTVWDSRTGRHSPPLSGSEEILRPLVWSPDGTRLAAPVKGKTVKIWEAATGDELLSLRGDTLDVNSVAWSPDGTKLATGSNDSTAKVWEASTGRELLTLRGRTFVEDVAWSPDGTKLAAANADETVQVYAISPVRILRLVRSRITRNLTPDECRRYLSADRCPSLPDVP